MAIVAVAWLSHAWLAHLLRDRPHRNQVILAAAGHILAVRAPGDTVERAKVGELRPRQHLVGRHVEDRELARPVPARALLACKNMFIKNGYG